MNNKRLLILALGAYGAFGPIDLALARDGDISQHGTVEAISTDSITVNGVSCILNASTKYQSSEDTPLSFADFKVGAPVHLQCRDGIARELELESPAWKEAPSASPSPSASASPSVKPSPRPGEDHDHEDDNRSDRGRAQPKPSPDDSISRENKTRLSPAPDVNTSARGRVEYKSEGKSRKAERRFRAWVSLPLPSSIPAAADSSTAASLVLGLTLSRAGVAYARCELAFDTPEEDHPEDTSASRAQFRLDVRARGSKLPSGRGSCDLDLSTAGIQAGVPTPQKGDSIAVDEKTAGVFLLGTF